MSDAEPRDAAEKDAPSEVGILPPIAADDPCDADVGLSSELLLLLASASIIAEMK